MRLELSAQREAEGLNSPQRCARRLLNFLLGLRGVHKAWADLWHRCGLACRHGPPFSRFFASSFEASACVLDAWSRRRSSSAKRRIFYLVCEPRPRGKASVARRFVALPRALRVRIADLKCPTPWGVPRAVHGTLNSPRFLPRGLPCSIPIPIIPLPLPRSPPGWIPSIFHDFVRDPFSLRSPRSPLWLPPCCPSSSWPSRRTYVGPT